LEKGLGERTFVSTKVFHQYCKFCKAKRAYQKRALQRKASYHPPEKTSFAAQSKLSGTKKGRDLLRISPFSF
jgi:hypothetical protein